MDLKTGYPYWLIRDGLPYRYPALLENLETEAVIIGGGISGALAAYYLAKKGIRCVMIDKRTVGLGSTCASTSLVQYELDKPLCELSKLVGSAKAEKAYLACEKAVHKLWHLSKKIQFRDVEKVPSLFFAAQPLHRRLVEKEYKARKAAGIDVKLLDAAAVQHEYGFKSSCAIESATGLVADVYLMSHALCRHAMKHGLTIYDRTEVAHITEHKDHVRVKTQKGAYIDCKYLVNASGYEAGHFMHKNIVSLYSTYALASEHLDDLSDLWRNRAMLWNTADPYLYMRLTQDNRIIIGGRDEKIHDVRKMDQLIGHKSKLLVKDFKKLFPKIDLRPEFTWAGTFGVTRDSLPFIGTIKPGSRIYYALGYGGNGILFSLIAAQIISDAIIGKKNDCSSLFSFDRA